MRHFSLFILIGLLALVYACDPYIVDDVALPAGPNPVFSMEMVPNDPNRVVVTDQSGAGSRLWDLGNGSTSDLVSDTAFFPFAGEYTITLYAAGDGGTGVGTQTVTITEDAPVDCDSVLLALVGGCGSNDSAVWVFANEAAAVAIGPTQLSTEWFSSPADGLTPEQYDDSWVFAFGGSRHQYYNNGQTVDPAAGFDPVEFDPPTDVTYTVSPGTGFEGSDQIILTTSGEAFIGVKNSGPIYDIVEITEERMVLLSAQTDGDGWFTQIFVRN